MKHLSILLIVGLCISGLFGQEAQKVTFNIVPTNSLIRVDGQVVDLSKQRTISLRPGTYTLEVWASEFEVEQEEIVVEPGRPLVVNKGLRSLSPEYVAYRDELSAYRTDKAGRQFINGTMVAANLGLAYLVFFPKRKQALRVREEIDVVIVNYEEAVSLGTVSGFREQYNSLVEEYKELEGQSNTRIKVGVPVLAISAAATAFLIHRRSKKILVEPTFIAKNPFAAFWQKSTPFFTMNTTSGNAGLVFKF
jgi:hypothetical protein